MGIFSYSYTDQGKIETIVGGIESLTCVGRHPAIAATYGSDDAGNIVIVGCD